MTSSHLPWRGLPLEVRQQIYLHLLVSDRSVILNEHLYTDSRTGSTTDKSPAYLSSPLTKVYIPLLLLHPAETPTIQTLFFTRNTFRLSMTCAAALSFLKSLPSSSRLRLRHLALATKALYYYDAGNKPFRALFNYISRELCLDSLEIQTHEGQSGVTDAFFREAAKGVFDCIVGELRVRYVIEPAYGLDDGNNVIAGRVIWDEWEETFAEQYAGALGRETSHRGDQLPASNSGRRESEVLVTPTLSPYWTKFFRDDQERSDLVKEYRSLCPFQLFTEKIEELGDECLVLVLRAASPQVIADRLGRMLASLQGREPNAALPARAARVRSVLDAVAEQRERVHSEKCKMCRASGAPEPFRYRVDRPWRIPSGLARVNSQAGHAFADGTRGNG